MVYLNLPLLCLAGLANHLTDASPVEKRLNNGVGVTPAMGWNNWNAFGSSGA
jgi:hypothetical protein